MKRAALETYISERFSVEMEHPWLQYPDYAVFRHSGNKKWFAVLMNIPRSRLGLPGDEPIDIMNVKCDPVLSGSLRQEPGFFPAYHMSKALWLSVALDGTVPADKIKWLLDLSYDATGPKRKKK